jgi:hypothetical protein
MTDPSVIPGFFAKKSGEKVNDEALECSLLLLLLESEQNAAANQLFKTAKLSSSPDTFRGGIELAFREKNWIGVLSMIKKALTAFREAES